MPKPRQLASYATRRRWTATDARAALSALTESGLTPRAFARRKGLDVQRLHSWRRKLGATIDEAAEAPAFVELRPRAAEHVEVVLLSGRVLRVAESVDTAALARLVEVLERPSSSPC